MVLFQLDNVPSMYGKVFDVGVCAEGEGDNVCSPVRSGRYGFAFSTDHMLEAVAATKY